MAFAGATSLFAALTIHEILVFGPRNHDLIASSSTPCTDPPCLTLGVVLTGQIAKAIGASLAFAIIGGIWSTGMARLGTAMGFWVLQYAWSLIGISSGYRVHFDSDWGLWGPFAELMWHPFLTPGLLIAGLGAFYALDRVADAATAPQSMAR
ncbi:hypothetical protein KUV65_07160 [Maritalea mobilis]|uniref:hypothetical protein n=1 Tax=Maritalea mobilis TaxID=483324 RepID=UPI001C94A8C0|nr:hypothetical protein [Maritalea mobilis]MBY6201131.1 hypothetical protein [Maritalea mobilis]